MTLQLIVPMSMWLRPSPNTHIKYSPRESRNRAKDGFEILKGSIGCECFETVWLTVMYDPDIRWSKQWLHGLYLIVCQIQFFFIFSFYTVPAIHVKISRELRLTVLLLDLSICSNYIHIPNKEKFVRTVSHDLEVFFLHQKYNWEKRNMRFFYKCEMILYRCILELYLTVSILSIRWCFFLMIFVEIIIFLKFPPEKDRTQEHFMKIIFFFLIWVQSCQESYIHI